MHSGDRLIKLGIFGGTFDPPHVGHLLAASDAFEALGLDRLVFVPNAVQPLKTAGAPAAPAPDRLEMVRRLCQSDPRFSVDPVEIERGGLSFMVDTLRAVRDRHPGAALFLLVGEDVVESLPSWREPQAIAAIAEIVVLARQASAGSDISVRRIATRRIDVSSTEIRERVRAGRSISGFVTESVAAYITERGLYR